MLCMLATVIGFAQIQENVAKPISLDEVVIRTTINRKFKTETVKPYLDDDYYKCWLPTIESEIAVFFPNQDDKLKKISSILFDIAIMSCLY